jgi:hypothetical protein
MRQFRWLILAGMLTPAFAQTVSVPASGLNAALRAALQKPNGPLTELDLLSLTNLEANNRNIGSITHSSQGFYQARSSR